MAQQDRMPEKKTWFDGSDALKWLLIIIIFIGAIISDFVYSWVIWPIRAATGISVVITLLFIALQTKNGQKAWNFMKGARIELHKVVWPTRSETIQTTLVVVIMVVITALILWGIDSFFMWAVAWMAGQGE